MTQPASPARTLAPPLDALFLTFLEVGISGFGGVLPFARRVLVERRGWLSEVEFNETLALCQSLPGPNIVNLSIVVGARFGGGRGALACVGGLTLAPVALILVVASLWARFGALGPVSGAIRGMGAAAAGLVVAMAAKMARPIFASAPWSGGLVTAAAFVAIGLARLPLAWALAVLAPVSVLLAWRLRVRKAA